MALLTAFLVASVLLPFALGYWIGQGVMAALPFAALGATVLVRQAEITSDGDPTASLVLGIVVNTAISAVSAYAGGRARERTRHRPDEAAGRGGASVAAGDASASRHGHPPQPPRKR